jgi:hypothetical protein
MSTFCFGVSLVNLSISILVNGRLATSLQDLFQPTCAKSILCAVSFLGIHKSEPDIYIGFSPALHLQCAGGKKSVLWHVVLNEQLDESLQQFENEIATKC